MKKRFKVTKWADHYTNNEEGKYIPCSPSIEQTFENKEEAINFYNNIELENYINYTGSYLDNKTLKEVDENGYEVENGFELIQYADENVLNREEEENE